MTNLANDEGLLTWTNSVWLHQLVWLFKTCERRSRLLNWKGLSYRLAYNPFDLKSKNKSDSELIPFVNNTSLNFVEKHKYSLLVYALERNGIYTDLAGSLLHVDKLSVKVVVITRTDKM